MFPFRNVKLKHRNLNISWYLAKTAEEWELDSTAEDPILMDILQIMSKQNA